MKHYLLFASQAYSIAILRPLQQAIRQQGHDVRWYIHNIDPTALKPDEKTITSVEEVKNFNPIAVFVPGNWVPDFFPGIKVEVFHGFGIEKKGHFDIRGLFDLYCTHGPATTSVLKTLQKKYGYFAVIETGWPKMDLLFQHKEESAPLNTVPTILYAPTFSPSLSSAKDLFSTISKLSKSRDWNWILKFHPKMDKTIQEKFRTLQSDNFIISEQANIIPLLHQADVMLSDTSSVVAEFLCLEKPVVTYKNRSTGSHIIDIDNPNNLETALENAFKKPESLMLSAKKFISNMHPYNDGKSSERILVAVDQYLETEFAKLKPKPLNLWRKWQIRRRLNYYHLK